MNHLNRYSTQFQDLFVRSVLNNKTDGTYLEIGGAEYKNGNNTFYLEQELNWRGVSIELDTVHQLGWQSRRNLCLFQNALEIDYDQLIQTNNLGTDIDYLQLDIDPAPQTLNVLKLLDLTKYRFRVITYEHDAYRGFNNERIESRKILDQAGYTRVISDVEHTTGASFEDWYVMESLMPNNNWKEFQGEHINMGPREINEKYKSLFDKFLA